MLKHTDTSRIRKKMVAIISLMLILVTTISFSAFFSVFTGMDVNVYAEKEKNKTEEKQEEKSEDKKEDKDKEDKEKKDKDKEDKDSDKKSDGKDKKSDSKDKKKDSKKKKTEQVVETRKKWTMDDITSSSYIVISGSTSEVILEKHSNRKLSPGRITQLVTAMVVIDNIHNENELTDNRVEITQSIAEYGSTFAAGESVAVGDLLDLMLITGDNEAAEALASYSTSTREIFIREMNSKSMALELMDTLFDNPTGLYSTSQYSTAKECASITQAACRYPYIKNALGQNDISFTVISKNGNRNVTAVNNNPLMTNSNKENIYKNIRGGVMGVLGMPVNSAQYAGIAVSDDMQLIAILMDSQPDMVPKEAGALLDYGDQHVTRNVIVEADKAVGTARIHGGASTRVRAYTVAKGFAYVPPEGSEDLVSTEVVMSGVLEAPLKAGSKVGEYRIYVADELKGTVDLVTRKDVDKGWILSRIYISNTATIVICSILLLILILMLRIRYVKNTRAKRREAARRRRIRELARQQVAMDEDRRNRDWNYDSNNYDRLPPRTTDIRREAIEEAFRKEQEEKAVNSGSKTDKRRAELRRKAEEKRSRSRKGRKKK